jgi:hypothetical protein
MDRLNYEMPHNDHSDLQAVNSLEQIILLRSNEKQVTRTKSVDIALAMLIGMVLTATDLAQAIGNRPRQSGWDNRQRQMVRFRGQCFAAERGEDQPRLDEWCLRNRIPGAEGHMENQETTMEHDLLDLLDGKLCGTLQER